ncbi:MAG TPA: hypothetical protein DCZ95_14795 [Verrucomicrobia bacterium]|nr:MAG: hypothetical protein A2X46_18100 [Lentisphaerae bacterium GWF2_57_35]HBA85352.1 hypothetical protein [Verrucomicrobiota bacterium]
MNSDQDISADLSIAQVNPDAGHSDDSIRDATLLVLVSDDDVEVLTSQPVDDLSAQIMDVAGGRKYHLNRMVAKGGMGMVYEARDVQCERIVALKVLLSDERHEDENRTRFVEEARITSKLEHPNIVPIHELGKDVGGNVFYSMKYVKGVTLGDILNDIRKGKKDVVDQYPMGRLLTIFQKICDAVAFAHANGVVHRDLKPGNIMIGNYGEVLVLDWGLAKVLPQKEAEGPMEANREARSESADGSLDIARVNIHNAGLKAVSGTVLGTPGFMAPEQVRNNPEIDERTDIYALGAILYSVLTLNSPIRERSIPELLRMTLQGEILPAHLFNQPSVSGGERVRLPHCPDGLVPDALSEIAMKAMSVNPSNRHSSVRELQDEIEAFQNGLVWHVVVDDDFSSPKAMAHWEASGGLCEIVDGELRLHGGELQILSLKRDLPGDVRIEFECRIVGSYLNDIGCLLGGIRSKNDWDTSISGYAFKYGAYTNTLNVLNRCDRRLWSEQASPLVPGRYYKIKVERVGARLRMFVDGREICSVVDPEPLTGVNRTVVGLLGWVADKRYRRIRISTLGTPWKSDALDMAERHLQRGHYATAMDLFLDIMNSFPDPDRMERANIGYNVALHRCEMEKNLPIWREQLGKAWPGAPIQLKIENDGISLEIPNAGIADLEPLRGIPLTSLVCWGNRIRSLEPLCGMPLVELVCSGNPIETLEPLRGMPLKTLRCERTGIRTLDALKGMQLTMFSCGENKLDDGLEALAGMPLTWLSCICCGLTTLSPLRGLPLNRLFCDGNSIEDLSPLKRLPLIEFSLAGNRVKDLESIRGASLNSLQCGSNLIESLEPLRGMPLSTLFCMNNQIRNLEPLRGMPLNALICGNNPLKDIGPFVKNPPKSFFFDCESMSAHDLEWVRDSWSRDFRFAEHIQSVDVLLALRARDVGKLRELSCAFGGRHYLLIPKFLPWPEARDYCTALGGHLATITSQAINDFVESMFPYGCSWVWLGLETVQGRHRWVTGEPVQFKAFANVMQESGTGPWIFVGRSWRYEIVPNQQNCFIVEWD